MTTAPHLFGVDPPVDEEAELVIRALARPWGAQPWRIRTERDAEWLLAKYAAAAREIAAAEAEAQEYRERIAAWLEDRTRKARGTLDWATAHLVRWGQERHDADPKVKSIPLPSGRVASVAGRLEWVIEDESAAIAWATNAGMDELVETTLVGVRKLGEVLKADEASGKVVTEDGEVVEGLRVARKERTWRVTPSV